MSRRHITRRQARVIADYVAVLQENLRLGQWTVTVGDRRNPGGCHAAIWIRDDHHEASIFVSRGFLRLSRPQQRLTLTHELAHLLLNNLHDTAIDHLEAKGHGRRASAVAWRSFTRELELATDDFAVLLAPHQPLPPKGWLD